MNGLLIRNAEVNGRAPVDVRIEGTVIAEIGNELKARSRENVIDAGGGVVLPGLCDHHVHLNALAAVSKSVQCGPPTVTTLPALTAALAEAHVDADGWVRGIGYTEDVAGLLDSAALDRLRADSPVRIQHRSGTLWMVNTAGARALGLSEAAHPGVERDRYSRPTGRLWNADSWLRTRLPRARLPDIGTVAIRLAQLGITHVTDATPDLDETTIGAFRSAMEAGTLPQHLLLLGVPLGSPSATGSRSPGVGPYKIIIADSALPDLAILTERIRAAHADGRAVAVHCVTPEALVLLLTALSEAGPHRGDRVEHGALIPGALMSTLRTLRLAVVTQPGFIAQRGDDYRRDVPAADQADLYRGRSLVDAGICCAISSDAPYGPLDPWTVMTAAMHRTTPSGKTLGQAERLTAGQAIAGYLSSPDTPGSRARRVAVGTEASLVVLLVPLANALAEPSAQNVSATIIGGSIVWQA